jgi:hypothetical protein
VEVLVLAINHMVVADVQLMKEIGASLLNSRF